MVLLEVSMHAWWDMATVGEMGGLEVQNIERNRGCWEAYGMARLEVVVVDVVVIPESCQRWRMGELLWS
jgi:hypothetical protein